MRQATTAMQGVVRASKTIRRTFGAVSMQGAAYPAAASVPHPPPPLCPFPLGSTFAVTNSPTPHPVSRTPPFPFSYTASSATTPYRQPHALLHGSGAAATNTIALTPVPSFNIRRWLSQTPAVMKDKTVSEPTQRNTQSTATGDAAEGGAAAPTGATEEGSGAREGFVPSQAQVAAQVAGTVTCGMYSVACWCTKANLECYVRICIDGGTGGRHSAACCTAPLPSVVDVRARARVRAGMRVRVRAGMRVRVHARVPRQH